MSDDNQVLAIVELGGYPDFSALYKRCGYGCALVTSMRKALASMKKSVPDIVVAEFNFQPDFRDRFSNLETLLAVLERYPAVRLIVFYEKENLSPFEVLRKRFPFIEALPFPVDQKLLEKLVGAS